MSDNLLVITEGLPSSRRKLVDASRYPFEPIIIIVSQNRAGPLDAGALAHIPYLGGAVLFEECRDA